MTAGVNLCCIVDHLPRSSVVDEILGEVHLESVDLLVFNKVHATPRLTGAFTSIPGYTYHYSNRPHAARSFPASLLRKTCTSTPWVKSKAFPDWCSAGGMKPVERSAAHA